MKVLLVILSITVGFLNLSEKYTDIPFQNTLQSTSPLYKTLHVNDTNALIISVFENSHWHKSLTTKYLIVYPNGKVTKLRLEKSKDGKTKSDLTRKKVKSKECDKYLNWLDSCISNNLFNLDQSLLNTDTKPSDQPGRFSSLQVSDGVYYNFSIHLNRETLHYSAYAPRSYIEENYPGKEDRIKFLEVIESFYEINKN